MVQQVRGRTRHVDRGPRRRTRPAARGARSDRCGTPGARRAGTGPDPAVARSVSMDPSSATCGPTATRRLLGCARSPTATRSGRASFDDLEGSPRCCWPTTSPTRAQSDFDADFLRDQWSSPGLDLSVDAWVVTDPRSTIVGHANVAPEGDGKLKSWGLVHPDHRGRGLGSVLLDRIEARAAERLEPGSRGPCFTAVTDVDAAGAALVRLPRVRARAVVPAPPARPRRPAARTRRPPDRASRSAASSPNATSPRIHAIFVEAFREEWGYRVIPFEEWVEPRGRDDQLRPEPVAPRDRRGRGGRGALGRRVGRPGLGRRARRAEALARARDRVGAAAARVRDVRLARAATGDAQRRRREPDRRGPPLRTARDAHGPRLGRVREARGLTQRDVRTRSARRRELGETLRDAPERAGDAPPRPRARSARTEAASAARSAPGFDRADVGILESSKGLSGKVVVAARLHRGQPLAEARERERVVAHGADVVLGLPDTPALDARARVERVDHAPPEDVPRDRRRGDEEVSRDRRSGPRPAEPSRRTGAGTVARRDGTEPPASSRDPTAARPAAGTPGRWSARARARRAAPRRARRPACASSRRARRRPEHGRRRRRSGPGRRSGPRRRRRASRRLAPATTRSSSCSEPQHALAESIPLLNGEHEGDPSSASAAPTGCPS